MSDSLQHPGLQHIRLPCPSPTPRAYSNSCPSRRWCHPTISSSVVPFSIHTLYTPVISSCICWHGNFVPKGIYIFSNIVKMPLGKDDPISTPTNGIWRDSFYEPTSVYITTPWIVTPQGPLSRDFPGQNTGVGCHFLPQGIFSTQGLNPHLLHWRWILYPLSHQGSPLFAK